MDFGFYIKTKFKDLFYEEFAKKKRNEDFDLSFKNIFVTPIDDCNVKIYITTYYHYYKFQDNEEKDCYVIKCIYNFERKVLKILEIAEYEKERFKYTLNSGTLVPSIKYDEYNIIVDEIISKYYQGKYDYINPFDLAKKMGLKIEYAKLSQDNSVFGIIVMNDSEIIIYNDRNEIETIKAKKGTVFLDIKASCHFSGNNGVNFTLMHECIHWYLHRKMFLFNSNINDCLCICDNDGIRSSNDQLLLYMIEKQANEIASRLLVPKKLFLTRFEEFYNQRKLVSSKRKIYKGFIDEMSERLELSKEAIKIQMIKYGIPVKGIYEYIDENYIESYTYNNRLLDNESYAISKHNFLIALMQNKELMKLYETGNYVFADNHFCIRNDKYVKRVESEYKLTDYALDNMEECCYIFEYSKLNSNELSHSSDDYVLNRKYVKPNYKISSFKRPEEIKKHPEYLNEEMNNVIKITNEINELEINDALKYVRNVRKISREQLADISLYSTKTIENIENGKQNISKINVLRIALSLNLYPSIITDLLRKAGFTLSKENTQENIIYNYIINQCYNESPSKINEILRKNGFEELFTDDVRKNV